MLLVPDLMAPFGFFFCGGECWGSEGKDEDGTDGLPSPIFNWPAPCKN